MYNKLPKLSWSTIRLYIGVSVTGVWSHTVNMCKFIHTFVIWTYQDRNGVSGEQICCLTCSSNCTVVTSYLIQVYILHKFTDTFRMWALILGTVYCVECFLEKVLFFFCFNTLRGNMVCDLVWKLEISVYFIMAKLIKFL